MPKDGTHYDLPIALALLASSGQLQQEELTAAVFAGELALDGHIRPISGAITGLARNCQASRIFNSLPTTRTWQAQAMLVSGITVYGVDSLKSLYLHLKQEVRLTSSE